MIEFKNGDWYAGITTRSINKKLAEYYHKDHVSQIHLRMRAGMKYRILNLGKTKSKTEAIDWKIAMIRGVGLPGKCLNRKSNLHAVM